MSHIRRKISDLHLPRPLQELDEQTADDGAVLEVDVVSTNGVVPVGHGDAVAGEVVGGPQGGDVALKVGVAPEQGGGPDQPVRLGVVGAVVQGHTVGLEAGEVGLYLALQHLGGEDIRAEELIPHGVVLHGVGAGAVEGQTVGAVTVGGAVGPGCRHAAGLGDIMLVLGLVAPHAVEETEASHTHDGLDGEVTVVGEVAREIVGAELILGVLTVL